MKSKNDEREEELREAPFLAKQKGLGQGLKIPENYFRDLQDQVIARLQEEGAVPASPPATLWQNWRRWRTNLASYRRLAASLAALLLLSLGWFVFRPEEAPTVSQLTYEEVQQYVEENIDEFDLELLARYSYEEGASLDLFPAATPLQEEEINHYLEDLLDEIDVQSLEELL